MPESNDPGPTAPSSSSAGESVLNDRYRLLDIVGEGGMATVWRAADTLLHRTVAVKILRQQYAADPEFLERFRTEARNAAALSHAGVVAVHDVGEDDGRHYLVMEYVPGRDLKDLIRAEAPLTVDRALSVGESLARAVAAAHAEGMIHRDIKPQNVLLAPDGRMKVADFGIARAASAVGMTAPGIVMGTVHYIAPEQARGEPATLASDVYSLGVVLFEMLTGQVPYDADSSLGVAMKIMNDPPPDLVDLNSTVPPALASLVARAMAREPAERFRDAAEFAAALGAYRQHSDQVTGALPAPGIDDAPPRQPATPVPQSASAQRGRWLLGPLLDWPGLGLGVVAALALAGLIAVWIAAINRLQAHEGPPASDGSLGALFRGPDVMPSATFPPAPTAVPQVDVPDVIGMTEANAVALLEAHNLAASVEAYESSETEGTVIDQRPAPFEVIDTHTVVKIHVAARGLVEVPALVADPAAMDTAIGLAGLKPQRRTLWRGAASSTVGQVIGLDPPPGTRQALNATVVVNVDGGPWLWLGVTFADGLFLNGVNLATDTTRPGGNIRVEPRWQAIVPISGTYVARAVLASETSFSGASGSVIGEVIRPLEDSRPTASWAVGETITGTPLDLAVAPDAAPGQYVLWLEVGYGDRQGERLHVTNRALSVVNQGRIRVSNITVESGTP